MASSSTTVLPASVRCCSWTACACLVAPSAHTIHQPHRHATPATLPATAVLPQLLVKAAKLAITRTTAIAILSARSALTPPMQPASPASTIVQRARAQWVASLASRRPSVSTTVASTTVHLDTRTPVPMERALRIRYVRCTSDLHASVSVRTATTTTCKGSASNVPSAVSRAPLLLRAVLARQASTLAAHHASSSVRQAHTRTLSLQAA